MLLSSEILKRVLVRVGRVVAVVGMAVGVVVGVAITRALQVGHFLERYTICMNQPPKYLKLTRIFSARLPL